MTPLRTSLKEWRSAPATIFVIAVLIVVAGFAIIFQNEITYRASRDRQATVEAEVLAASVTAALDFADPVAAQETVNAFRANRQVRFIGVFDRGGRPLASYSRSRGPLRTAALSELPDAPPTSLRVAIPVNSRGQRIGTVVYELDREAVSRRLTRYGVLAALAILAALVILTLGMTHGVLRRANKELGDRAEALSQANLLLEEQIEQRAKAEDQLRQSQKMQALGQLTGGIAHDFNNLLTVIQGSADMLCRDELPEPKRKRFAQAIVQASSNAAVLTSQLLAFARRQPLKPEPINLNHLIVEMSELIDRTMGERIDVKAKLASRPCQVIVDRSQLQSAILNIASNARDAMDGGGRLRITVREASASAGEPTIDLEFSDTGSGMDPETIERIFEPFFTTKKTGQGTGLGLSQVYGFASQSGGEVLVSSKPGSGTVVTLRLPCTGAAEEPAAAVEPPAIAEQAPAAILVVEDNEEVGAFAETLLSELGHEVTRASSGEQALELTRARDFDIVFSDVVMPGMGGLKLAEILADERPGLPVVLATGYSQEIAQSGSGGRPVILKPYRLATVSEALASALREHRH
ncbi:MAG TPA: ATP-binding protein [Sphingomicrobium sp.]|jgi:signal transduction histidine kinase/CheY-like chemotaxis protein|nr:ATP-binding protein [Sphingomicrobium sp.]